MKRMASKRLVTAAFTTLAAIAPFAESAAQQPAPLRQPDVIPIELAAALISTGGFSGEPQFLVGTMPEWFTNRVFIPSDAKVLGAAFLGTTVTGVISLPATSDSVIPEFKKELLKRGWTVPPVMPRFSAGGFNPAPAVPTDASRNRVTLCSDQQILTVSAARRGGVATDVTLRMSTGTGISACHLPQIPTPASMLRLPFPTLVNPQGAVDTRMTGDCSATMMGSMGTGTTLRTTMPADALLDHFSRQLTDSGWTSFGEKAAIVGRSFARTDSTGTRTEVTITVVPSARDAGCRDINLQARTLGKP